MIKVHHLENSRSQRILWMLEELHVAYEVKRYEWHPKTQLAPESLKEVHPLGKSPLIEDSGRVFAESGAIIEYLGSTYGQGGLWPDYSSPDYRQVIYWLHYAEGSLMPPLLLAYVFNAVKKGPMPFFMRPVVGKVVAETRNRYIGPQIQTQLQFVASQLEGREWLVGDQLTAADIQMSFPLEAAMSQKDLAQAFPAIESYVRRFQQRPAYQRALTTGGPYAYDL